MDSRTVRLAAAPLSQADDESAASREMLDGELSAHRVSVEIITLFPQLFQSWLSQGVVSRAVTRGIASVRLVDLRPHGVGRHHVTDDYPFGGGAGMVMKPEPLFAATAEVEPDAHTPVILLSPTGRAFNHSIAAELSRQRRFILLAGHYEGVDERVREHLVTDELSIGDFVLSAGELAAMVVVDAVVRLVPGAIAEESTVEESFSNGLLEYPQYTRPATFRGWSVPEILLSGNHEEIRKWRREQALRRTYRDRPDLLPLAHLTACEREVVRQWEQENGGGRGEGD